MMVVIVVKGSLRRRKALIMSFRSAPVLKWRRGKRSMTITTAACVMMTTTPPACTVTTRVFPKITRRAECRPMSDSELGFGGNFGHDDDDDDE